MAASSRPRTSRPRVAPDGLHDVPATRPDPFPAFANFASRAFDALSWPALPGAARRGEPYRAKSLGDAGPADEAAPRPVGLATPPDFDPEPTPVARGHRINADIMAINRAYWSPPAIAGTLWRNHMLVATRWPTVTRPIAPGNDGRYFPGLRIESNTPVEPYQLSDGRGDPDPNRVNVTMETKHQDSPASRMGRRHAVSNARGRGFVAILPETK